MAVGRRRARPRERVLRTANRSRQSSPRSFEQCYVLRLLALCGCRNEVQRVQSRAQDLPDVAFRMECGAEISAGVSGLLYDQFTVVEPASLGCIERIQARSALRRDHEDSPGTEHTLELIEPRPLQVLGKVREHRDGVDEIECLIRMAERRG